jgi:hypothetical protein
LSCCFDQNVPFCNLELVFDIFKSFSEIELHSWLFSNYAISGLYLCNVCNKNNAKELGLKFLVEICEMNNLIEHSHVSPCLVCETIMFNAYIKDISIGKSKKQRNLGIKLLGIVKDCLVGQTILKDYFSDIVDFSSKRKQKLIQNFINCMDTSFLVELIERVNFISPKLLLSTFSVLLSRNLEK